MSLPILYYDNIYDKICFKYFNQYNIFYEIQCIYSL